VFSRHFWTLSFPPILAALTVIFPPLAAYRLHLVLPLTAEHKRQQLDWCWTREHWDIEDNTIVFSDYSRFCLGHHDLRQRVKKRRVEWRNFEFSVVRHVSRK
jgi:hypothetical protein